METSHLLARVIGISWLVLFIAMVVNWEFYKGIWRDVVHHPVSLIISGLLILICGLLIINVHSAWTLDWKGLITLTGWMLTVGGVARLVIPKAVLRITEKSQSNPFIFVMLAIILLIGIILTWAGFKL